MNLELGFKSLHNIFKTNWTLGSETQIQVGGWKFKRNNLTGNGLIIHQYIQSFSISICLSNINQHTMHLLRED